ncbi:cell division protein FtsL [Pseudophaeobacter flagellatus]|uniref:cell division protein FtsL n=1 Tax=Pseudophaeobacter flagellatus TaxID=2899119 RepID=UPI001E31E1B5|nr:cell division protein FtsL [Pseudophaeobacter flagellatus]MCD9146351.1 cell division protein FtsL [Pseudophaeobacter flagellatus]
MKSLLYVITALAVFGLAFWAYRENYATQQVLKETRGLQRQIGAAQIRLNVLRAEWAYLNRPDRLLELAELNFASLGLLPLRPDQFGRVDEVTYPLQPELTITEGVEVSGLNARSQSEQSQ